MTTLQPGTKVLIEATVEQTDGFGTQEILIKTKYGAEYWLDPKDLTVCETAQPIPTPSFKAGQEVEWINVADDMPEDGAKVLCYSEKYNDSFTAVCHNKDNDGRFEFSDKCFYWAGTEVSHWKPILAPPTRPIPAQPTVESELREILWTGAGHASMCWEPRPSGVFDEKEANKAAKNMYDQVIAWHQKYTRLSSELRNLLEDVVNELELSDGMIEKHGPLGTEPSKLVRLVLDQKDQQIKALKAGMIDIKYSGRVEVSVPTWNEIEEWMRDTNKSPYVESVKPIQEALQHFMTRKEAK